MTGKNWDAFHRRGEVLRAVADQADARRDGVLPLDLPGVAEAFGDELSLLAALQLRWSTRLSGRIDRALLDQPTDLESAVVTAWRGTASELAGVRMVLDRALAGPASTEIATALDRARAKEWTLMAAMAGRAGLSDAAAPRIGRELEEQARLGFDPTALPRHRAHDDGGASLLGRLRAVLAA